eukprot:gnl/MRDRNA2_/MRDRNA2_112448_c0_seq1.p1 gnl/MRDRNA2_/MRDRNA2_112448_c0~~gnl/MRDRNA2_/MRDRNA2_112448_c0_seq1.p1  ORF type:complete len:1133 (-),score=234.23 gnl/MRDRNA2_/MRDRNA2_112448_c0_seq1:126-3524(-)
MVGGHLARWEPAPPAPLPSLDRDAYSLPPNGKLEYGVPGLVSPRLGGDYRSTEWGQIPHFGISGTSLLSTEAGLSPVPSMPMGSPHDSSEWLSESGSRMPPPSPSQYGALNVDASSLNLDIIKNLAQSISSLELNTSNQFNVPSRKSEATVDLDELYAMAAGVYAPPLAWEELHEKEELGDIGAERENAGGEGRASATALPVVEAMERLSRQEEGRISVLSAHQQRRSTAFRLGLLEAGGIKALEHDVEKMERLAEEDEEDPLTARSENEPGGEPTPKPGWRESRANVQDVERALTRRGSSVGGSEGSASVRSGSTDSSFSDTPANVYEDAVRMLMERIDEPPQPQQEFSPYISKRSYRLARKVYKKRGHDCNVTERLLREGKAMEEARKRLREEAFAREDLEIAKSAVAAQKKRGGNKPEQAVQNWLEENRRGLPAKVKAEKWEQHKTYMAALWGEKGPKATEARERKLNEMRSAKDKSIQCLWHNVTFTGGDKDLTQRWPEDTVKPHPKAPVPEPRAKLEDWFKPHTRNKSKEQPSKEELKKKQAQQLDSFAALKTTYNRKQREREDMARMAENALCTFVPDIAQSSRKRMCKDKRSRAERFEDLSRPRRSFEDRREEDDETEEELQQQIQLMQMDTDGGFAGQVNRVALQDKFNDIIQVAEQAPSVRAKKQKAANSKELGFSSIPDFSNAWMWGSSRGCFIEARKPRPGRLILTPFTKRYVLAALKPAKFEDALLADLCHQLERGQLILANSSEGNILFRSTLVILLAGKGDDVLVKGGKGGGLLEVDISDEDGGSITVATKVVCENFRVLPTEVQFGLGEECWAPPRSDKNPVWNRRQIVHVYMLPTERPLTMDDMTLRGLTGASHRVNGEARGFFAYDREWAWKPLGSLSLGVKRHVDPIDPPWAPQQLVWHLQRLSTKIGNEHLGTALRNAIEILTRELASSEVALREVEGNMQRVVETVVLRVCHPDRHSSGERVLINKFSASRAASVLPEVLRPRSRDVLGMARALLTSQLKIPLDMVLFQAHAYCDWGPMPESLGSSALANAEIDLESVCRRHVLTVSLLKESVSSRTKEVATDMGAWQRQVADKMHRQVAEKQKAKPKEKEPTADKKVVMFDAPRFTTASSS